MQAISSAADRVYLRPDFYRKLEAYYSDRIFRSNPLNCLVLRANMLVAFLYRHVMNAAMQSDSTMAARKAYQRLMQSKMERSRLMPSDFKLLGLSEEQLQSRNLRLGRDNLESFSPGAPSNTDFPRIATNYSRLHVPERSVAVILTLLVFEALLLLRYSASWYVLSEFVSKEALISSSKQLDEGFKTTIAGPIKLNYATLLDVREPPTVAPILVRGQGSTLPPDQCREMFLQYFDENFNEFRIWTAGRRIDVSPLIELLLPEQRSSFQVFLHEVRDIVYLLACFLLTSGFVYRVYGELVRYDLTAIVFVFDPKFVAYQVQLRLNYYLDLIRKSYLNYWSTFYIASDGSLVMRTTSQMIDVVFGPSELCSDQKGEEEEDDEGQGSELEDNNDEASGEEYLNRMKLSDKEDQLTDSEGETGFPKSDFSSPSAWNIYRAVVRSTVDMEKSEQSNIIDSICLSHRLFADYVPTVRSQIWRRFLVILNPMSQFLCTTIASSAIMILWYYYLNKNNPLAEANKQLMEFLSNNSDQFYNEIKTNCPSLPSSGAIRKFIVDNLLEQHSRAHTKADYETFNSTSGGDKYGFVAEKLQPLSHPGASDWWVVSIGLTYAAAATSLYFNAYIFTMSDLCFWLFELRMKLNICTSLLKRFKVGYMERRGSELQSTLRVPRKRVTGGGGGSNRTRRSSLIDCEKMGVGAELDRRRFKFKSRDLTTISDTTERPGETDDEEGPNLGNGGAYGSASLQQESGADLCNISVQEVLEYLGANHTGKEQICERYAARLNALDHSRDHYQRPNRANASAFRRSTSEKFLTSTYLDFRLFQDIIDDCRNFMNYVCTFAIFHALNLIIASSNTSYLGIKIGLIIAGVVIANIGTVGASFFQSQCSKLHAPIYAILASSTRSDKTIRHLSLLWRRLLTDLAGARSKFSLRVCSINVNYATTLQFNLTVASLYILAMDKSRFG